MFATMGTNTHEKVGGGFHISHFLLQEGSYLLEDGRIANNQACNMILEIDLHRTENGLQEGMEFPEIKLTSVEWIGLVALLGIEDSIGGGNDCHPIRFKCTVNLLQMGLLAM